MNRTASGYNRFGLGKGIILFFLIVVGVLRHLILALLIPFSHLLIHSILIVRWAIVRSSCVIVIPPLCGLVVVDRLSFWPARPHLGRQGRKLAGKAEKLANGRCLILKPNLCPNGHDSIKITTVWAERARTPAKKPEPNGATICHQLTCVPTSPSDIVIISWGSTVLTEHRTTVRKYERSQSLISKYYIKQECSG